MALGPIVDRECLHQYVMVVVDLHVGIHEDFIAQILQEDLKLVTDDLSVSGQAKIYGCPADSFRFQIAHLNHQVPQAKATLCIEVPQLYAIKAHKAHLCFHCGW